MIFPSEWLSSSTWVIGMPYFTAVVISARYCPNPPSPVTASTCRASPTAAHAPIAAGKPKPMEPR